MRIKCTTVVLYLIFVIFPLNLIMVLFLLCSVDKVSAYISTLLSKKSVHSAAFGFACSISNNFNP